MNAATALHISNAQPPLPVLYTFRRCPYAMRARLAVSTSGIKCELREVVLRSKPVELLAASPKATVPVLVLPDGEVIAQSLEIMRWALMQHDPHDWLTPQTETLEAALALISENDEKFKPHLDRYKYPNRFSAEHTGTEQAFAQSHRCSASKWLWTLEARLSRYPWMFGASASLADMAIAPFIRQFARTEAFWFDLQPWPHLRAWLARWECSVDFQRMMERYPPWRSGQQGVIWHLEYNKAPPAGT